MKKDGTLTLRNKRTGKVKLFSKRKPGKMRSPKYPARA